MIPNQEELFQKTLASLKENPTEQKTTKDNPREPTKKHGTPKARCREP